MTSAPTQTSEHRDPLGTMPAARLVAAREISTQVRSKAFIISLLITVVVIVGGIVLTGLIGGDDDEPIPVAAVGIGPEIQQQVGPAGLDVTAADTMDEAEHLLREEEVEAILTVDDDSPVGFHLIGLEEEPVQIAQLLSVAPTMDVLDTVPGDSGMRYFVAMGFGLVFMVVAMGSGMMIVQNTILEKQNRIVEILLSAIPARALLIGKILGNSALAIGQAVVMGAAAALGLVLTGQQDFLQVLTWPMLWFVLFFVPGFVLIASMFAASASLVSRQEDSGSVITPTMMLVMAPYFVAIFFLDNSLVMTIASYVPFAAPVAMPLRLFMDDALWFEPLLSMGLLVLATALVMSVAAKIYSRSLLQTGQRVKLSAALRSAD